MGNVMIGVGADNGIERGIQVRNLQEWIVALAKVCIRITANLLARFGEHRRGWIQAHNVRTTSQASHSEIAGSYPDVQDALSWGQIRKLGNHIEDIVILCIVMPGIIGNGNIIALGPRIEIPGFVILLSLCHALFPFLLLMYLGRTESRSGRLISTPWPRNRSARRRC